MFAKILLAVLGLGIVTFFGCNLMKKNNTIENNAIDLPDDLPVITAFKDIDELEKQEVYVSGIYKLKDMRMRKANPEELFKGHAEIVFEDKYSVILMPPDDELAIRSEEEQTRCNGQKVYAKGTLYPYIPWGDSNLKSPCLVDIEFIKLAK